VSPQPRVAARVGNRPLSFSNLDKVLWPRDDYTKGDLIDYYRSVAKAILPHLKDRPLTLQRYPNGIDGASFFEKNLPKGVPEWVERVDTSASTDGRTITYVVCNDEATLAYVANLASIVLHAWTSRVESLDEPDFVFFDVDPGEKCTLKTVATVTLGIRDALSTMGLQPLVKTSGGMGLHVFVPLASGYSYDVAKVFAEVIARLVAGQMGKLVTLERAVKKRSDQAVYLDYVQVGRGKTYVVPYSVRARDGAPVSTPLEWSEVEGFARRRASTAPEDEFGKYTIATTARRLKSHGDLWGGKAWKKQRLEPVMPQIAKLWEASRG
jgi:bifunctional non-homologous end joining protein LigD